MKLSKKKMKQLSVLLEGESSLVKEHISSLLNKKLNKTATHKENEEISTIISNIKRDGSEGILTKLLPFFNGATLRGHILIKINDPEFLKEYYDKTKNLTHNEIESIAIVLMDDLPFIEKLLQDTKRDISYELTKRTNNLQLLLLLKEYTQSYYKRRVVEKIKELPKSIKFVGNLQEDAHRYQPYPELIDEFTETLKGMVGEKEYLNELSLFLKRTSLLPKDKMAIESLIQDLKEAPHGV